jgi:hypothetical protein
VLQIVHLEGVLSNTKFNAMSVHVQVMKHVDTSSKHPEQFQKYHLITKERKIKYLGLVHTRTNTHNFQLLHLLCYGPSILHLQRSLAGLALSNPIPSYLFKASTFQTLNTTLALILASSPS